METWKVQASPGLHCPKEGKPRQYITDEKPVEVPESAYYRRLLDDGSLVRTEDEVSSIRIEDDASLARIEADEF